jgi:hypothetical protein
LRDRNVGFRSEQHQCRIGRQIRQAGAVDFFNLLTGPELLEMTEEYLPEHRERLYPPTVTLSMFMKQSLALDRSCQRAVDAWAGQRTAEGLSVQSIRTGGYCRARARLPLQMVVALTRETGRLLSAQAPRGWRWRGRCVKLADGTGISMPDTAENQARYPQPRSQAPGVGFPMAGLVGIVCLSTGAVLEAAIGAHASKGQSEQDLFRGLLGTLRAGDVLLADLRRSPADAYPAALPRAQIGNPALLAARGLPALQAIAIFTRGHVNGSQSGTCKPTISLPPTQSAGM